MMNENASTTNEAVETGANTEQAAQISTATNDAQVAKTETPETTAQTSQTPKPVAKETVKEQTDKVDTANTKATPEDELKTAREQLGKAMGMAMDATARAAALGLGVRADRVAYAVRLADLSGIDLTKDNAAENVSAAISKVLDALPELKTGTGTGGTGNHPRSDATPADPFTRGFDKG